jgi:hypothetical protein
MRKTRFMSVLFLVLSAAFFFVPQFRQAFGLPIMMMALESSGGSKYALFPNSQLQQWAREAEAQREACGTGDGIYVFSSLFRHRLGSRLTHNKTREEGEVL